MAGWTARIATAEHCHLRHGQREVVVPAAAWDVRERGAGHPSALHCIRRIASGELYLQPGFGRKTQGSYYTPWWLARYLAATTLEPLLSAARDKPAAILRLRILDPAMGTGVLLSAAHAVLGEALQRHGYQTQLAARCLFGIDRDPVATHLAKLTLADIGAQENERGQAAARPRSREVLGEDLGEDPGQDLVTHLRSADALTDPELEPGTFDAVICNPPWEKSLSLAREFFAAYDPHILTAPTGRERLRIQTRLLEDPAVASAWDEVRSSWRRYHDELARRFQHQTVSLGETHRRRSKGHADLYRYFVERAHELCRPGGMVGLILPNSFYANEGATGIRRLLLDRSRLLRVDGFVNERRIFDAAAGLRFCLVFFRKGGTTRSFPVRFGMTGPEDLNAQPRLTRRRPAEQRAAEQRPAEQRPTDQSPTDRSPTDQRAGSLRYSRSMLRRMAPEHLSFPECRTSREVQLLEALYARARSFRDWTGERGIRLYQEMNMTHHAGRLEVTRDVLTEMSADGPDDVPTDRPDDVPTDRPDDVPTDRPDGEPDGPPVDVRAGVNADVRIEPLRSRLLERGFLILHEKGTFQAYDDGVQACPRYLCPAHRLEDRPHVLAAAEHYRLAARATIHAGEAHKSAFCMLPPGVVVGNSALAEATPQQRSLGNALVLLAIVNSRCFGFAARARMSTNLNQFILGDLPVPPTEGWQGFLADGALRLSANHAAYVPLWHACREKQEVGGSSPQEWAPLSPPARGRLWAALDAAVAFCYGLTGKQYEGLLAATTWPSPSKPTSSTLAPDPSLATSLFEQIIALGAERFQREEDLCEAPSSPDASRRDSSSSESSTKGS